MNTRITREQYFDRDPDGTLGNLIEYLQMFKATHPEALGIDVRSGEMLELIVTRHETDDEMEVRLEKERLDALGEAEKARSLHSLKIKTLEDTIGKLTEQLEAMKKRGGQGE